MQLKELLEKVPQLKSQLDIYSEHPALELEVTGLSTNSQTCQAGDLFLGMPGTKVDGGDFWASAIASGAVAALVSPAAQAKSNINDACVIACDDMVTTAAAIATAFYDQPTSKMQMVGVTGTNGKTTTTHLIEYLLNEATKKTALLGTLYARWPGYSVTATHTTPFATELQKQLALAVNAGCQFGVMEVSSHALAQKRVLGCQYDVTVFTNLTQDHLDFHKDFADYFEAKALLFSPLYLRGKAIINIDDQYGRKLVERLQPDQVITYSTIGQANQADLWADQLVYQLDGVRGILHTPQGEMTFNLPLVGQYNLANMMAAVGTVLQFGLDLEQIAISLSQFPGVPGRVEKVQVSPDQDISVIVDYAHTPDSLENLLKASRPFIPGKMICVFGCGGDRDRTKRPQMGKIAADLADLAIVTSDNPRTEDPQQILQDVVAGIPHNIEHLVIGDRAQAIKTAILQAKAGDGILIAGKGHEDYQILGTEKIHFDDREEARKALKERFHL